MASARKCDRCGNYYDGFKDRKIILYRGFSENGYVETEVQIDLCPACVKEFEEWRKKYEK